MDQPPAVAFTAFADAWPRAIETEIGAALCTIGCGKGLFLTPARCCYILKSDTRTASKVPGCGRCCVIVYNAQSRTHAEWETNMATTSSNILCLNFNEDQGKDDLFKRMYLGSVLHDISKLFLNI